MSQKLFGEASKHRNKKREKKTEQEKLEGKSLDIKDGGMEDFPLLGPQKVSGIGVLISQM